MDAASRVRLLEDRQRVLSTALRGFAEATTDYEALLEVVAKTLAEVVKDGCVVRVLGADGWLMPVAMHFLIPKMDYEQLRQAAARNVVDAYETIGIQACC